MSRPELSKEMDSNTFRNYYYLREELISFCKDNKIPAYGGKEELADRIAFFLDTGLIPKKKLERRNTSIVTTITRDTLIEEGIICSEVHRTFFKKEIGESFSFYVPFQKWLKSNPGRSYGEAVEAYYRILEEKKTQKSTIDKQFEYNTYIRDFFEDNKGRSLEDAICCWKYKKSIAGHNRYEPKDLEALKK